MTDATGLVVPFVDLPLRAPAYRVGLTAEHLFALKVVGRVARE